MSYGSRLEDLLALTQMGAVSGPDALSSLYSLQDQRQAQRQERQAQAMEAAQAQQDSALDLASLAYSSASEGDPLSMLLQNPQFVAGASQLGINPRQVAKQTGYYGQGGVSALSPELDEEDIGGLTAKIHANPAITLDQLAADVASAYGPDVATAVTPQLLDLIKKYGQGY